MTKPNEGFKRRRSSKCFVSWSGPYLKGCLFLTDLQWNPNQVPRFLTMFPFVFVFLKASVVLDFDLTGTGLWNPKEDKAGFILCACVVFFFLVFFLCVRVCEWVFHLKEIWGRIESNCIAGVVADDESIIGMSCNNNFAHRVGFGHGLLLRWRMCQNANLRLYPLVFDSCSFWSLLCQDYCEFLHS